MFDALQNFETHSEGRTIEVAREFARGLKAGDVVALHGDLGAGKSVFCRSIIRALCADADMDVPSPTYTIVQNYDFAGGTVAHFDLYRLSDPEEVYEIGWEDALADGIVLVEWPSRLGKLLPAKRIDVTLCDVPDNPNHRKIEIRQYERADSR